METIWLFIFIAGFVIGLGAVTVIDIHGFLGRKSEYWTETTIRAHKVTKPLIWLGMILATIGGILFYKNYGWSTIPTIHLFAAIILILNGLYLSFVISPRLLEREANGKSRDLLPHSWQKKIMISLIVSDIGWWGSIFLLAWFLTHK